MIKNLTDLAKFVEGGADVLQKAISSDEEIEITLVKGDFVSDEKLETLKTQMRDEGKNEGQNIGYDFAMKDLKKDFGIELEGKDRKKIGEAIKKQVLTDAKIEPEKKISELKQSLEKLQQTYDTDLGKKDEELKIEKQKTRGFQINSDLSQHLPELNGIKPAQFLTLARSEFSFDYGDNGNLIVKKGDSVLKDKMENPLAPKDILTEYAKSNGWMTIDGRGGGDEPGGSGSSDFKTIGDVYKYMEDNKIDPMSSEGQKLKEDFNNSLNK